MSRALARIVTRCLRPAGYALASDVDVSVRERPGSPEVHVRLTFTIRRKPHAERVRVHESEEVNQTMNDTKYEGGSNVGAATDAESKRIRRDAEVGATAPEVTPVETNLSGGEQNNGPVRG